MCKFTSVQLSCAGLTGGQVAGVVIGVLVGVTLLTALIMFLYRHRHQLDRLRTKRSASSNAYTSYDNRSLSEISITSEQPFNQVSGDPSVSFSNVAFANDTNNELHLDLDYLSTIA